MITDIMVGKQIVSITVEVSKHQCIILYIQLFSSHDESHIDNEVFQIPWIFVPDYIHIFSFTNANLVLNFYIFLKLTKTIFEFAIRLGGGFVFIDFCKHSLNRFLPMAHLIFYLCGLLTSPVQ